MLFDQHLQEENHCSFFCQFLALHSLLLLFGERYNPYGLIRDNIVQSTQVYFILMLPVDSFA